MARIRELPYQRKSPGVRNISARHTLRNAHAAARKHNGRFQECEGRNVHATPHERTALSSQDSNASNRDGRDETAEQCKARQLALARVVGAARADPFNCWPVTWYRDLDANFDFLVNSFGPSVFGYLPNTNDFDIFKTQTQLALTDPAAFHSLMIVSTTRKGVLAGQTLPSMSALWHKVEAVRMVKDRLDTGDIEKCTTEGTIYAVMVLMGIGAMWNAVDKNEFSPSALNILIVHKGGLKEISEKHPILEASLFGMAVLNSDLLRSDLYTINDPRILEQPQDSKVLLWSLLGFLRATSGLKQKVPVTLARIQSVFAPGTVAYSLLMDTPDHPGILDHRQRRLQMRLRAHISLYVFSILIWASPFQIQEFLHHLEFVHNNVDIWRNSLRMFAWALVCNVSEGSLMFSMQAWQSFDVLCAGVRLPDDLRVDVLSYCINLLTGKDEAIESAGELGARIRSVMFRSSPDYG